MQMLKIVFTYVNVNHKNNVKGHALISDVQYICALCTIFSRFLLSGGGSH